MTISESNENFDFEQWRSRLRGTIPPAQSIETDSPWLFQGQAASGPSEILIVESLREAIARSADIGHAVPCDVFCFGLGEPRHRHNTKVGGLPYWPRKMPWPRDANGRAMTFVAQLCFRDSQDIVGPLPGDILLVFASGADVCHTEVPPRVRFEWQRISGEELIPGDDVPSVDWRLSPMFGVRHRSADYPNDKATEAARAYLGDHKSWWNVFRWEGTKIGGVPFWIQYLDLPTAEEFPGRFLGTIGSLGTRFDSPFPWVNHAGALTLDEAWEMDRQLLQWGDSGLMYLSLDDNADVHFVIQYY